MTHGGRERRLRVIFNGRRGLAMFADDAPPFFTADHHGTECHYVGLTLAWMPSPGCSRRRSLRHYSKLEVYSPDWLCGS